MYSYDVIVCTCILTLCTTGKQAFEATCPFVQLSNSSILELLQARRKAESVAIGKITGKPPSRE